MKSIRFPALVFVGVLSLAPTFAAEPITGRASVIDGDTLDIGSTRIRLHGIDAPESGQLCQDRAGKAFRCGQAAAIALADRIGSTPVSCDPRGADKYGRTVAVCRKGAEDLSSWLVAQGHAIAYRRYSKDYVPAESTAKAGKLGMWAGSFAAPGDWRKGERAMTMGFAAPGGPDGLIPSPTPTQPALKAGGCAIKGNISRKGEKVFHVPGSRDYDRTRISEKDGERMFCSEDEAKAAGWRAPR
ncbi:thermonuclease family protein [Methylobacterium sp. SD274]|uniref:thermonuclease family protein n=1 Tax=Methylobacterium sp. SD274 TaxID=2782009 RepID=UPI001A9597D3|nr:thermonuclease family protein [Methylobacterium sp. SD274]MBO1021638.1 thermonuclease family protein [Methylobacterium sp. SD274]